MTTTTDTLDMDKVMEFVGGMVTDLGAAVVAAGVVIGHRLGLYRALAQGPTTPAELAERTGTSPRYISEWLAAQAASGYVQYDETAGTFAMTEEQAFVLTDPDGPIYLPGAYVLALGALKAEPRITEAFRSGGGMGWHEHDPDVFVGCETFFRPGYVANIVDAWLPALDGVEEKLRTGARVADIGCGHGASTVLMATAYPASTFTGSDYHDESVRIARKRAAEAGVADRTTFETASATTFSGHDLDLVTSFDCLHDMGDPVGAARHVRETLAPDGTWMVVEPAAGDTLTENLNPVGRLYYAFSALLCVPNGRSQAGGYSLGAQAGPAAIRQIATDAGFTRFRQAAATPFNLVYEVRP
jgi:ubiquinone/menaquinone biosynthesis C-methylase UbiE